MRTLIDSYINTGVLHHAYALVGQQAKMKESLFLFLEHTVCIPLTGNPDLWHETHETFGIDDARRLKERQSARAASDSAKKIFIFETAIITHEAQNALLKIFEEPTRNTHFFLIIPDVEILLPTLRSRLVIAKSDGADADLSFARIFLKSGMAERFVITSGMVENKDRFAASALLNALETLLHASANNAEKMSEYDFIFSEIANSRAYLRGRAPSLKLILEHLTLIIPRV